MRSLIVTAIGCALVTGAPAAGPWDRDWTGEPSKPYQSLFDRTTLTSIEGVVVKVGQFKPAKNAAVGVELLVTVEGGDLRTVHLAPEWVLKKNRFRIESGDLVHVTGSRVKRGARPILIATSISCGSVTLDLRTPDGMPLWLPEPPLPPSI